MLLTAGADLTDSIAGVDDEDVVKPGVSIGMHGDDSDDDVGVQEEDARYAKNRGIPRKGGGRANMHTTNTTVLDDSPSIVRKRGVEDDDEF